MRRVCRERFPGPTSNETTSSRSRHASRHAHDSRAVMHVGIANPPWREKSSRHSRHMHNPQLHVSGKRPILRYIQRCCNGTVYMQCNLFPASMFASKIWWTKGLLDGGVWHWADSGSTCTWFVFDPASNEDSSATRVSLKTDNWMNEKSNESNPLHKICELRK